MSKLLPKDFSGTRYGLSYRLVDVEDASFILSLRTDERLARHIHPTEPDIRKQEEWTRKYKEREAAGTDYYFIYFLDSTPVGVNRVYNIFEYYGTEGSWICAPGSDPQVVLSTYLILHDTMFGEIGLDLSVFDVRKDNKKVNRMHKMFGAVTVGESDIDYYYTLNKNTYFERRERFLKYY